ncbi:MAG: hypothetical protein H7X89_13190 [Rhizobiales bacterium]|nr:hypothetical protein [Hyphomicrobiales bacterium]
MKCTKILVIAAIAAFSAMPAIAHEEFRLVGVITKLEKTALQLKRDGDKAVNIKLDGQTKVTKDKRNATAKVGDTVVVDALGDSFADLSALEVKIVDAKGKP